MADPFIYLVAAETSGDYLGAELARALKDKTGGKIRLEGLGGKRMAAEGIVSPFDISEISVLGYFEAIAVYRRVIRRADEMADRIAEARPDAVVLIDSWGFSIRLADRIRARNPKIRLIKYVGPQVISFSPSTPLTPHFMSHTVLKRPLSALRRFGAAKAAMGPPSASVTGWPPLTARWRFFSVRAGARYCAFTIPLRVLSPGFVNRTLI